MAWNHIASPVNILIFAATALTMRRVMFVSTCSLFAYIVGIRNCTALPSVW